jgi:hypothetical protein
VDDDQPITVIGGSLYVGGTSNDKWDLSESPYGEGGGFRLSRTGSVFQGVQGRFLSRHGEVTFSTMRLEDSALRLEIDYRHGIWPVREKYTVFFQTTAEGKNLRIGSTTGKNGYRCLVSPVQNLLLMVRKGEVERIRILGVDHPRTIEPLDGMFKLSLLRKTIG